MATPRLVKDIWLGEEGSYPSFRSAIGDILFFRANDGVTGSELWRTDGTDAGTFRIADLNLGLDSSGPDWLTAVGDIIFFSADDGISGRELWKSDGTAEGTMLVKDIQAGEDSSDPRYLTAAGGILFFAAFDETNGVELWKTDGTAEGTKLVTDLAPGNSSSFPSYLTAVGDSLLFSPEFYQPDETGDVFSLWKTDGTAEGTVPIRNTGTEAPRSLVVVEDRVIYVDRDNNLWQTDLTEEGTVQLADLPGASRPRNPVLVGANLFFTFDDGIHGEELWKTDGTPQGTGLVRDIWAGEISSTPSYLVAVGDALYFSASDGISGYELWRSDGTDQGTVLVSDLLPGSLSSFPYWLTLAGNTLYFAASDGNSGDELWALDVSAEFAPTRLSIKSSSAEQPEGNSGPTNVNFVVVRSGDTTGTSTAEWAVVGDGNYPVTGDDFVGGLLPTGTVTFDPGQTEQTILIPVAGDLTPERPEGFRVVLSNPTGAAVVLESAAAVVLNDDPIADLVVTSVSAPSVVDQGGSFTVNFEVTNQGTSPTQGTNWIDRIYLSRDTRFNEDDLELRSVTYGGDALAANASYGSGPISISFDGVASGSWNLLFRTDHSDDLAENNEENNLWIHPLIIAPPVVGTISAVNGEVQGVLDDRDSINPARDGAFSEDYQIVDLVPGNPFLVALNADFDAYLQIVDADNQNILESDDDSGTGTDSLLLFVPQAGLKYLLRVTSYDLGETGAYSLIVNPDFDLTPPRIEGFTAPAQLADGILNLEGPDAESPILSYSGQVLDEGSGFYSFYFILENQATSKSRSFYIDRFDDEYNSADGTFTADLDFSSAAPGAWTVSYARLEDDASNEIRYSSSYESQESLDAFLAVGIDLTSNAFNFTVFNPNADLTPPRVEGFTTPIQLADGILDLEGADAESAILSYSGQVLDEGSGFSYFNFIMENQESGSRRYFYINRFEDEYNSADGSFTTDLDFSFAASGAWAVSYAVLDDDDGNEIYYSSANESREGLEAFLAAGIDLTSKAFNFTVINPNADLTPPRVEGFTSPAQLGDGILNLAESDAESAILSYSFRVLDKGSGFAYFRFSLENQASGSRQDFSISRYGGEYSSSYNPADGSFTADFDFSFAASGAWAITHAQLEDFAGNAIYYSSSYESQEDLEAFLAAGIDLTSNAFNFTVINPNADLTPPRVEGFTSPVQLADGMLDLEGSDAESAILSYSGRVLDEGSGFRYFEVTLENQATGNSRSIYIDRFDDEYNSADGSFTADLDFSFAAPGSWTVREADLEDVAGNKISYWRYGQTQEDLEAFRAAGIDLTSNAFNFTVINPNADPTPPRVEGFTAPAQLADGILNLAESDAETAILSYSGQVLDEGSGFRYFEVTLENQATGSRRYFYIDQFDDEYNVADSSFSADLDFSFAASGAWSIRYAYLEDIAGNEISYSSSYWSQEDLEAFLAAGIDLTSNAFNFTVINPNADLTPPRVEGFTAPAQLADGILNLEDPDAESPILSYSGQVLDEGSGFDYFEITLENQATGSRRYFYIDRFDDEYNSADGSFTADLDFSFAEPGAWTVREADLEDVAGNWIYYWRDDESQEDLDAFQAAGIDLTSNAFNFNVVNPSAFALQIKGSIFAGNGEIRSSLDENDLLNGLRTGRYSEDYEITGLKAGTPVTVSVTADFDAFLQILDIDNLNVIAFNDDSSSDGFDSALTFTPDSASRYVARVTSYEAYEQGAFVLRTDSDVTNNASPVPAVISLPSPFSNTLTEDTGVDAAGFIVSSGFFGIVDPDAGEAAFKTNVGVPAGVTNLGTLTISTDGAFTYRVLNSLDAVQSLRDGETRSEVFTIESLDGTKLDVTFSIVGVADVLSGVVADGYLAGAMVFADTNGNRVFDADELSTTTDDAGNFSFDFGNQTATLISIGGTDISTGLPFKGSLTAPAGSQVINPLTTLVTAIVEAGGPPADSVGLAAAVETARAQVVAGLGLPENVNLTTFDPLSPDADPATALAVQRAAASVANVIVVSDAVGADSAAVLSNLATAVTNAGEGQTVDLGSVAVLTTLLTTPATPAPLPAAIDSLSVANTQIAAADSIGAIADMQTVLQSASAFVQENATVDTVVFQAPTPDGMTAPIFSLKDVDDRALVSIEPDTGAIRLLSPADFESKAAYRFTVVASQEGQATVETAVTVAVSDVNESPTALALSNTVTSLEENSNTTSPIKVADIVISDDALGSSTITLSGADAGSFELVGTELFLKAGTVLDFENKASYAVTVTASDPDLPGSSPVSADFSLSLSDVNELPTSPTQTVFTNSAEISYQPGEVVALPLLYDTSSGDTNLTGLTLNVHYNSLLLTPAGATSGVSDQLPAAVTSATILADDTNSDGDPLTDKIVQLLWASLDNTFPNQPLPASLATVSFATSDNAVDPITGQAQSTTVRYTATETATNYDFLTGSTLLTAQLFNLDVDGDGRVTALGDGLMIIRKLFGAAFAGNALTNKAISLGATRSTAEIHQFIQDGIGSGLLDVDRDGKTTALGDGLMVIRYMFGQAFAGDALTAKAISNSSSYYGQENASTLVRNNIESLSPMMASL